MAINSASSISQFGYAVKTKRLKMNKLLLILLLITTNSFAWRIDYNLSLPGSSPAGVDVINYLIFSKELVSVQNEKMRPSISNSPIITTFDLQSDGSPRRPS